MRWGEQWFRVGLLALLLAACSVTPSPSPEPPIAATVAAPAGSGAGERVKIKTPDEQAVVAIAYQGDGVKLEFSRAGQPEVLRGELKESGKRKYTSATGDLVAEVKADDGGFKLRTAGGRLLWKVKFSDDTIKISDNEENANPFELDRRGDDRVKVKRNETELGNVRFYSERGKIKIEDAADHTRFESNADRLSALYGVLLMEAIPETERYIIMGELLARGR